VLPHVVRLWPNVLRPWRTVSVCLSCSPSPAVSGQLPQSLWRSRSPGTLHSPALLAPCGVAAVPAGSWDTTQGAHLSSPPAPGVSPGLTCPEFKAVVLIDVVIAGAFCFLQYWGLNSRPTLWVTPPALFCDGCFSDRVSQTIYLGWLWTAVLLISASWVVRIAGVPQPMWLLKICYKSGFCLPKPFLCTLPSHWCKSPDWTSFTFLFVFEKKVFLLV
jgi:hypothetical protein